MPVRYELHIPDDNGGTRHVRGEFSDADWSSLADFIEAVDAVAACSIVRDGAGVSITAGESPDDPARWTLPPEEAVLAFLTRIRKLVLEKDHTCFTKVRAPVGNCIREPVVHDALKQLRGIFDGDELRKQFTVAITKTAPTPGEPLPGDAFVMNCDRAANILFNGFVFHPKRDRRAEWQDASGGVVPLDALYAAALPLLMEQFRACRELAAALRRWVERASPGGSVPAP